MAAWSGPACSGAPAAPRVQLPQGVWSLLLSALSVPQWSSVLMHSPGNCRMLPLLLRSSELRKTQKKGAKGVCQCSTPPAQLAWRWSPLIPDVFPSRGVGPAGSSPLCPVCPAGGCPCPAPRRARRNPTFEERGHHCRPWLFPSRSLSYFC